MTVPEPSHPLQDLLRACTSDDPIQLEQGWRELLCRYKTLLYKVIINRADGLKAGGAAFLHQATADDIFSEVIYALCADGCRLIKNFKAVDNERSFRGYLAVITARMTDKHLTGSLTETLNDQHDLPTPSFDHHRQLLFEQIVAFLRAKTTKREEKNEFKILLFNLYTFGDFSASMIGTQPIFKKMGHRVLDNVVNRMRTKIYKSFERNK